MKLRNIKIGHRLATGFGIVLLILVAMMALIIILNDQNKALLKNGTDKGWCQNTIEPQTKFKNPWHIACASVETRHQ